MAPKQPDFSSSCSTCQSDTNSENIVSCANCDKSFCSDTCKRSKKHTKPCKAKRRQQLSGGFPGIRVATVSNTIGQGVFATKDYKVGDLIFAEKPLLRAENQFMGVDTNAIEQQVEELTKEQRDALFALHDSNNPSNKTPYGIFQTNSVKMGDPARESGLFLVFSRINHSCCPNVHHSWNTKHQHEEVRAVKEIRKGEEILTSYMDIMGKTRSERRERLEMVWKFTCQCSVCSLTGEELEASDRRRAQIGQFHDAIPGLARAGQCRRSLQLVDKVLDLLKEEHIDDPAHTSSLYYDAFQSATMMRDMREAKRRAKKALDTHILSRGPDGNLVAKYELCSRDPQAAMMRSMMGAW